MLGMEERLHVQKAFRMIMTIGKGEMTKDGHFRDYFAEKYRKIRQNLSFYGLFLKTSNLTSVFLTIIKEILCTHTKA